MLYNINLSKMNKTKTRIKIISAILFCSANFWISFDINTPKTEPITEPMIVKIIVLVIILTSSPP